MTQNRFPPDWDTKKMQEVIEYYENQTEDEAVSEAEEAFSNQQETIMVIPKDLVPIVRKLIAKHQAS